jgi:hypothetical protein
MHNGNEKVKLVEVTPECLAEVAGGARMTYRTSSVMEYTGTTFVGAIGAANGPGPIDDYKKA